MKTRAFPVAGQVLCAVGDRAVLADHARAGDADEGREADVLACAVAHHVLEHFRQAIDQAMAGLDRFQVTPVWRQTLERVSEGRQTTLGALSRPWQ